MKGTLLVTNRHELLPFAHRLRREGETVHTVVWNSRYEDAWSGLSSPWARRKDGGFDPEAFAPAVAAATGGDLKVVTTVEQAAARFTGAPHLFGPLTTTLPAPCDRVMFGAWWNGTEALSPHLLVADWGAWTGGQGATVLGGLSLVRPSTNSLPEGIQEPLAAACEVLTEAQFRGLFHFDCVEDPEDGRLRLRGLRSSLGTLHAHAFLGELESFSAVLEGRVPNLTRRYVTVLPVTQPPWPSPRQGERRPPVPIGGLTDPQVASVFWHDIHINPGERRLLTAANDGFVGVVVGSADGTPLLARTRALEIATRMELPEKQARMDAGHLVENVLATLEDRWGVVL